MRGPEHNAWTFGSDWSPAACNVRGNYSGDGEGTSSESPTGAFRSCVSSEGVYDLTGNMWEWVSEANTCQGAGWRIIAERFRPEDHVCEVSATPVDANYRNPDVGFRCCR